jgi:hypothetical protein
MKIREILFVRSTVLSISHLLHTIWDMLTNDGRNEKLLFLHACNLRCLSLRVVERCHVIELSNASRGHLKTKYKK